MNRFTEALDLLDNGKGWGKGHLYRGGQRCLLGAISNAQSEEAQYTPLENDPDVALLADIIMSQFPGRVEGPADTIETVYEFNDYPQTRFDDVRVVLEKAAARKDELI